MNFVTLQLVHFMKDGRKCYIIWEKRETSSTWTYQEGSAQKCYLIWVVKDKEYSRKRKKEGEDDYIVYCANEPFFFFLNERDTECGMIIRLLKAWSFRTASSFGNAILGKRNYTYRWWFKYHITQYFKKH